MSVPTSIKNEFAESLDTYIKEWKVGVKAHLKQQGGEQDWAAEDDEDEDETEELGQEGDDGPEDGGAGAGADKDPEDS